MYKGPNKVLQFPDGISVLALERQDGTVLPCFFDTADYPIVSAHRWILRSGYAALKHNLYMHTLLTGLPQTDHRNTCRLDNRRSNLRPATTSQNTVNTLSHKPSVSGFRGVRKGRGSNWRAEIRIAGRKTNIGTFPTAVIAAKAYDAAALATFKDFARLNFTLDKAHNLR